MSTGALENICQLQKSGKVIALPAPPPPRSLDKGDMEMNVHGGEIKNAELDPEKKRCLDPVG